MSNEKITEVYALISKSNSIESLAPICFSNKKQAESFLKTLIESHKEEPYKSTTVKKFNVCEDE